MPTKYRRRVTRACAVCGKPFEARVDHIKIGHGLCCSRVCACSYIRRSKPSQAVVAPDGLKAKIPLHTKGGTICGYATIDAADAQWASQWPWSLIGGYATRSGRPDGLNAPIWLHRELLGLPRISDGRQGDHIDRDRLNDQRTNLRILPRGRNAQNRPSVPGSSSPHRGVHWNRANSKWLASVHVGGKHVHFGCFDSQEEAAEAARAGRARLMPYAVD